MSRYFCKVFLNANYVICKCKWYLEFVVEQQQQLPLGNITDASINSDVPLIALKNQKNSKKRPAPIKCPAPASKESKSARETRLQDRAKTKKKLISKAVPKSKYDGFVCYY